MRLRRAAAVLLGVTTFPAIAAAGIPTETGEDTTAVAKSESKKPPLMRVDIIERLQGRWAVVDGVNQGRQLSAEELEGTYVTIKTNVIATYDADKNARFRALFTVDETKKPFRITMDSIEKGKTTAPHSKEVKQAYDPISRGIIEFKGPDTVLLCYHLPGGEQPKKFAAPKGSKLMFFKLQRIKPKPADTVKHEDELLKTRPKDQPTISPAKK